MFLHIRAIVGILIVLIFTVPLVSSALTTEEILAQIQSYSEQIAELQRQLQELRRSQEATSTPPWQLPRPQRICALLAHDIPFGSNSDIVRAIQEALAEDRAVYPEGLTTGYFGPLTQAAIQRLLNRLETQGFATTTLPLGERDRIGPWLRQIILRYWCARAPSPITPELVCPLLVATTTPAESCTGTWEQLKGWRSCHIGWRCVPVSRTLNQQPAINSFEGPTELTVGQSGTWTVQASDPENDALTYRIMWGDESVQDQLWSFAELDAGTFASTTTFTHVYARAGHYAVHVAVRDSAGNIARAIAKVKVKPPMQQDEEHDAVRPVIPGLMPDRLPDNPELKQRVCPLIGQFGRVLTEGAHGDDVRGLQELLRAEGFLNVTPTGYLGPLTRTALQGWQVTHNICGIGFCPNVFDRGAHERMLQHIRSWCEGYTVPIVETLPMACTMDAMQCPDGTYVGRTGPTCEFKCPTTNKTDGSCVVHNSYCVDTIIPNGEIAHHSCCAVGTFQLCQNGVLVATDWNTAQSRPRHATNACGRDPSYYSQSDIRLKENISPIQNALDKLAQLNGIFFNWKDSSLAQERQIGIIAQEVQKVFPEAVIESNGVFYVNYHILIAPIIQAIKELKEENDALRASLNQ